MDTYELVNKHGVKGTYVGVQLTHIHTHTHTHIHTHIHTHTHTHTHALTGVPTVAMAVLASAKATWDSACTTLACSWSACFSKKRDWHLGRLRLRAYARRMRVRVQVAMRVRVQVGMRVHSVSQPWVCTGSRSPPARLTDCASSALGRITAPIRGRNSGWLLSWRIGEGKECLLVNFFALISQTSSWEKQFFALRDSSQ